MRTLVTGLNGFTGHYIQSELEAFGHTVVGLSSNLTDSKAIANEIAAIQPEAVIHLAAISFIGHGNPNTIYEVNLIGTRNLLAALEQHAPNVSSILLVSSANIYGNRLEGVLSENTTPDPANDYAISKLAMEQMASLWVKKLPLFIVRPFNYTGIRQDKKFLIPKIIKHFRERKSIIELGNLEVWREFGDVRTVADAYRRLMECCPVGKTINISTGQTYSLQEVVRLCEDITQHEITIEVNPKFVRANEVRILKGDNSQLKKIIGRLETRTLEDTLQWMLL